MKYILIILILLGCAEITTSKHRCDNKVGIEKEACVDKYDNFVRNLDYRSFRAGGNKKALN